MSNSKKENVLNSGKKAKSVTPLVLFGASAVLVALSIFFFLNGRRVTTSDITQSGLDSEGSITFPAGDFQDGEARYYSYPYQGKDINFFLLKSSDGVIRSAFDACDVCYPAKKGYRQEGDFMVCNNCGQRFSSVRINEEKGGCNPSPLERTLIGDLVTINESDLIKGAFYF